MKWKTNNLLFIHVTRVVSFLILAFSIYLFFAGHNDPGGGFIGGLMTASSILLLYLTFDKRKIDEMLPIDYVSLISAGLLIAFGTGFIGLFIGDPYLTQYFDYFTLPWIGEFELATAVLFDVGIYLGVAASALVIILTIAGDQ
ncbi:multicomponent Na+:H+ antiporter subunit B [Geomicrobium halophilum]|uniref:Multicomponent Na+:H+ antiporter subunit B n=1 Tax=Geomicrobium halophilum TaxID=549000 RepID=A0A841Q0C5_9BACL|nr:Na(+)/H(+) antiporter subunit B [Geomicrobium halophilum]MBB6448798.1 multicomponent Na+:H+ antiporter subunit B [Geomicrobium halophilum]